MSKAIPNAAELTVKTNLRNPFLLALGCGLIGGILLVTRLDQWDFWGDEMNTVHDVQQGIGYIWHGVRWHPPLYLLIAWGWTRLWGLDEITLRLTSVLPALLSIFLIYCLGREWGGERYGVVAAFLLAISPLSLLFSRMGRYYSLAMMLSLASLLSFWKAITGNNRKAWLGYIVATTLLFYTFYPGLAVPLGNGLFLLWRRAQYRHAWKPWMISLGIVFLLFAPLFVSLPGNTAYVASHEGAELSQNWKGFLFKLLYTVFVFGFSETISPANWPIVIPGVLLVSGTLSGSWKILGTRGIPEHEVRAFLLLHLGVAGALMLFITSTVAKFEVASHFPTLILFVFPLFLLFLAVPSGLGEIRKGIGILIGLTLLNTYGIYNYFAGKQFHNPQFVIPWKSIAETIRQNQKNREVVFASDGQLSYYCPGLRVEGLYSATKRIASLRKFWLVERDRGQRSLVDLTREIREEALKQGFRCVWRQHYVPLDPRDVWLKEKILGRPVAKWNVIVECYERSDHPRSAQGMESTQTKTNKKGF